MATIEPLLTVAESRVLEQVCAIATPEQVTRLLVHLICRCTRAGLPYDDCAAAAAVEACERPVRPTDTSGLRPGDRFVRRFNHSVQEMIVVSTESFRGRHCIFARSSRGNGREYAVWMGSSEILFVGTKEDYLAALRARERAKGSGARDAIIVVE